jgi:hypothetical protein
MSNEEKKPYAKNFKNHKVLLFDNEGSVLQLPVHNIYNGMVETSEDIYPIEKGKKFYSVNNGGFVFVFNLDFDAKVEASHLKTLRRSMALKNLFAYDREKVFDMKMVLPYLVALAVIIFN